MIKKDQEVINRLQAARIQLHKAKTSEEKELRRVLVLRLEKDLKDLYKDWENQDRVLEVKMHIYSSDNTFN